MSTFPMRRQGPDHSRQAVDAADHDVGPQAAMVLTEGNDGTVGGH